MGSRATAAGEVVSTELCCKFMFWPINVEWFEYLALLHRVLSCFPLLKFRSLESEPFVVVANRPFASRFDLNVFLSSTLQDTYLISRECVLDISRHPTLDL